MNFEKTWLSKVKQLQREQMWYSHRILTEKIAQLMNSYYNGLITNEEVIKELLRAAEEIANLYKNGQELGFHKKSWHL